MKQEHRNDRQETIVQLWSRVPAPLQGICILISVSSFAGASTQVKDSNFRLTMRSLFPHHQPIRRESHTRQPSLQILPLKILAPKASRSSGLLSMNRPFLLLGPAINLSLLQTLTFPFVRPHCASGKLNFSWKAVPEQFIIGQVQ